MKFFAGNILSGGAAGSTSLVFVYPLDFARTRLAADIGSDRLKDIDTADIKYKEREFNGLIDCLKKVSRNENIFAIYRGFPISLLGIIVYRSFYFGLFDTGKVFLFPDMKKAHFLYMWGFAQAVTVVSGILSYPIDTIRRRMMMTSGQTTYRGTKITTAMVVREIYTDEGGVKAFYKGCLSNVVRGTCGALVLVLYDKV